MNRLARIALAGVLVTGVLGTGCGSDSAEPEPGVVLPPEPPAIPEAGDLTDDFEDDLDSLALDSLTSGALMDSSDALDTPEAPPAPTFEPFLSEFKAALQNGEASRLASGVSAADLEALADPEFQREILAAGPDRYRRDGTLREAFVVVGFDGDGNVVPEDEALTESGLGLVFDVVDGQYRLIRIDRAG